MSPFELVWLAGPEAPGSAALRSGSQLVGRGRRADIVSTCTSVAREHCRLTVHDDGSLELESLEVVTVAGQPVEAKTAVKPGDEIKLGDVRFVVQAANQSDPQPKRQRRQSTRRHRSRASEGNEIEALSRSRRRSTGRISRESVQEPQSPEELLESLQQQLKESNRELRQANHEIRKLKSERRKLDAELESLREAGASEAEEATVALLPSVPPAMRFSPELEPMMALSPEPPFAPAAKAVPLEAAPAPIAESLLAGFGHLEVSAGAAEPLIEERIEQFERARRRRARDCEELLIALEQQMSEMFEARLAEMRKLFE